MHSSSSVIIFTINLLVNWSVHVIAIAAAFHHKTGANRSLGLMVLAAQNGRLQEDEEIQFLYGIRPCGNRK